MPVSSIIVLLIVGVLLGAVIGWIGSVVKRSETNAAIYLLIATGAAGGILAPLLIGLNSNIDSVVASTLGATALVSVFAIGEKRLERRTSETAEQRQDDQPNFVSHELVEERIAVPTGHLPTGNSGLERSGVRVRSVVEERPVSQQVTLREEHLSVERRPATATAADE